MELHWGDHCQVYVTPVSREEVCVAMVSSSPKVRLDDALAEFPELCARLENAEYLSSERGAITITRRLRCVYRGRTVLVGDASGGVDAITGEGLCLTFRQAALLGRLPGEFRSPSLSGATSHAGTPSGANGSDDAIHG